MKTEEVNPQARELNQILKGLRPEISDLLKQLTSSPEAYDFCREVLKLEGAFTAGQMISRTQLPEASVYRSLKRLRDLGLVTCVGQVRTEKRRRRSSHRTRWGGPRPYLWSVV